MSDCHTKKWKTGLSKDISSAPFSRLERTGLCDKSLFHRMYHPDFWYQLWIQLLSEREDYDGQRLFSCLSPSHNETIPAQPWWDSVILPSFIILSRWGIRISQNVALAACFRTTAGISMSRLALIYSWLSDLCACYYSMCFLLER